MMTSTDADGRQAPPLPKTLTPTTPGPVTGVGGLGAGGSATGTGAGGVGDVGGRLPPPHPPVASAMTKINATFLRVPTHDQTSFAKKADDGGDNIAAG